VSVNSSGLLLVPDVIEKELLDRAIIRAQYMADGSAAHQMTNLLGHILHVVTGAFNFLGHKQYMKLSTRR